MYEIFFVNEFNHRYAKLTKNNKKLQEEIRKAIKILAESPFYPSLKTHRAGTRSLGDMWCSWVAPDMRIAWDFEKNKTIIIYTIGTHSGKYRIYG